MDDVWKEVDVCWMDGDDNHRNYNYFLHDLPDEWQENLNSPTYYITNYTE